MGKFFRWNDIFGICLLIALVFVIRIDTLPTYPIPSPIIHDEFANMLGAETFALGRITNPPALFSGSLFEFQTLGIPTRMMIYPPATAGFMALGMVYFGHAYWGIVLCMALAMGAMYWALSGWLHPLIALAGAVFCALLFRAPHYWIYSYWGGGPILLASALMLGAYPRVFIQQQYHYISFALLGGALALFSRPFEGGVLALCLTGCGVAQLLRFDSEQKKRLIKACILPLLCIAPATLYFQGYYNHSITGHWWSFPYALYSNQYLTASSFVFGGESTDNLSAHYALKAQQMWDMQMMHLKQRSGVFLYLMSFSYLLQLERFSNVIAMAIAFIIFVGAFIAVPIFFLYRSITKRYWQDPLLPLTISWVALFVAYLGTTGNNPHYLAPQFATAAILLGVYFQRHLLDKRVKPISMGVAAIIALCLILQSGEIFGVDTKPRPLISTVTRELLARKGKDIIFVDQRAESAKHPLHYSIVHNMPDIDNAEIIWAWYLSPAQNQQLIKYYEGRNLWYIRPDIQSHPVPYQERKEYEKR